MNISWWARFIEHTRTAALSLRPLPLDAGDAGQLIDAPQTSWRSLRELGRAPRCPPHPDRGRLPPPGRSADFKRPIRLAPEFY
jgi:hypothetical protein